MRLIDADAMVADLLTVDPKYKTMIDWCRRVLEAQPTVDAVPVIRCRDCKYWRKTKKQCGYTYLLPQFEAEEYCSRAERKDHVKEKIL